jgi:hypothetical protein
LVTGCICFACNHDRLQSLGTVSSTVLVVNFHSSGTKWTNSSSWSNPTTRLARLLNSNSNCLHWGGAGPAFELPLNSWTPYCSPWPASHSSVRYCSVGSRVWPMVSSCGPQRDYQFVPVEVRILIRYHSGSIVVKALCYKPEGRGFEIRWGEWFLSIYLILPAALGPGVYSASNRNEYHKHKNNVSGE